MPQTIEDLGKMVKQKYPNAYGTMSDAEVGRKVKEKYPQYAQFSDVAAKKVSKHDRGQRLKGPTQDSDVPAFLRGMAGVGSGIINTLTLGGRLAPPGAAEAFEPTTTAGKIGEGLEQAAEYMIPVGGAVKGGKAIANIGREALKAGVISGAQTGTAKGAATGAALGAVGGAVGEAVGAVKPKVSRSIYEAELRPGKKPSMAQRSEMVSRGLKPGKELPIEERSIGSLSDEIGKNKARIDALTKTPGSPYSSRSIPIDDLLKPVDDYIKRVDRVDHSLAESLRQKRADWAKSLGYVEPTAETQQASSILDSSGKPVMKTVPGTKGNTEATVSEAQRLKEDLYSIINDTAYREGSEPGTLTAGRKLAARGLKRGVEKTLPEHPIGAINHVIENDMRLKDSITSAVKSHPSWLSDWSVFILGSGAGELMGGHMAGGAMAVGALARMAARNPRIMSRIAIALEKSGVPSGQLVPAAHRAVSPRNRLTPPDSGSLSSTESRN